MASAGTAAYMAPEQIRGQPVTPATDVYALGVMLFEMLTGQRPFRGTEPGTQKGGDTANERIRYAHLHTRPPDPRTLNPSIPDAWAQIILKALDKNPAKRYRFMQELLEAACIASGLTFAQVTDRINVPSETQEKIPPPPTTVNRPYGQPNLPASSGRTILPWLAGGIVLALIMILAFSSMNGPTPPEPTPTVETIVIYDPPLDTPVSPVTAAPTRTKRPTAIPTIPLSPTESSSGRYAQISNEVLEVNLRSSPGYTDIITKIPTGEVVEIIGGPVAEAGLTWWNVSWRGYEGWMADHTGSGRTIMIFDE
jgi:serine/threonine protein kinase